MTKKVLTKEEFLARVSKGYINEPDSLEEWTNALLKTVSAEAARAERKKIGKAFSKKMSRRDREILEKARFNFELPEGRE